MSFGLIQTILTTIPKASINDFEISNNKPEQKLSQNMNKTVPHMKIQTIGKFKICLMYGIWKNLAYHDDKILPSYLSESYVKYQNEFDYNF